MVVVGVVWEGPMWRWLRRRIARLCRGESGRKAGRGLRRRRVFTLIELSDATKGFSRKQKLGEGGFGCVFRGVLGDGTPVAVKRCSRRELEGKEKEKKGQAQKEFLAEVALIAQLRHQNLVPLRGWCRENSELLLVYDFMPNGSLDRLLADAVLPWPQRCLLVLDIAAALHFLHFLCRRRIVHRDVKSSNVLIDGGMRARLGDFGMAMPMEHDCTSVAGTTGYLAPEAVYCLKATDKMDVFSFGVLVLEILTGRGPVDMARPPEEAILIDWVWELHKAGRLLDAADRRLGGKYKAEEMSRLLQLGLVCSHPDPAVRPGMDTVMDVVNLEAAVPPLPDSRPLPFFTVLPNSRAGDSSSPSPSPPRIRPRR